MAMSWRTASYFSSSPTAATNPPSVGLQPQAKPADHRAHSQGHRQAGAIAQTTERIPHTIFCLNPSAPRRSIAAGPVRRPVRILRAIPAAKYINIDAFNGKTVTRKTLLRYTLKSPGVNLLIRGNVWKKACHN